MQLPILDALQTQHRRQPRTLIYPVRSPGRIPAGFNDAGKHAKIRPHFPPTTISRSEKCRISLPRLLFLLELISARAFLMFVCFLFWGFVFFSDGREVSVQLINLRYCRKWAVFHGSDEMCPIFDMANVMSFVQFLLRFSDYVVVSSSPELPLKQRINFQLGI